MQTTIYYNKDFVLIRKPHGIPSTFGKVESFLDMIKETLSEHTITWTPLSSLVPAELVPLVISRVEDFKEVTSNEEFEEILRQQVDTFGQDQEFGLLNRLDNETGGFLYFARSPEAFAHFKSLQKSELVKKFYLAQTEWELKHGNMEIWKNEGKNHTFLHPSIPPSFHIQFPIMHSKSNPEKMVAIRDVKDVRLGRSQLHEVSTQIDILQYDKKTNVTTMLATITKGVRHQIRVHMANNGTAIIGDNVYGKTKDFLHLRSIGFQFQE